MSLKSFSISALVFALVSAPALSAPPAGDSGGGIVPAGETARTEVSVRTVACPQDEHLAALAPDIENYLGVVCRSVQQSMQPSGDGTGQLVRDLKQAAEAIVGAGARIDGEDLAKVGFSYLDLKRFVNRSTGGKGMHLPVTAFSDFVVAGNKTLQDSGFGFIVYEQDPLSKLLEAYWNFVAMIPRGARPTQDEIKRLSDLAYPENAPHEIRLPLHSQELEQFVQVHRFSRYELVGDDRIEKASDIPLFRIEDALKGESWWYTKLQKIRFALTAGVISLGAYGTGGLSSKALTAAGSGIAVEYQFTFFTGLWGTVWAKGGIFANIMANAGVAAIMASSEMLHQYVTGQPIVFDPVAFSTRTGILTFTQVAAMGPLQVISARLRDEGQISEGMRFLAETICATIANLGRTVAIVAGIMGSEAVLYQLNGAKFGLGEAIGMGLQGAIFATVASPILMKRMFGDRALRDLIAYKLIYADDPQHRWNKWLFGVVPTGPIRKYCAEWVAWAADVITPRRTLLSSKE